MLNLLAGSYVLASVPRTVWILQHASDDVAETRVVVTCCKNNDGDLGPRTVWTRANGLWTQYHGFDWEEWDHPERPADKRRSAAVSEMAVASVFDNGGKSWKLAEAVKELMKLTGKRRSHCYDAMDKNGKFATHFYYDPKTRLISWIP